MNGTELKRQGIAQVSLHGLPFLEAMRKVAINLSQSRGFVTADDLRPYAADYKIQPHHQNVWGGIFRGRSWKCVGRVKSRYPNNHAREIRVWRWEPSVVTS